MLKINKKGFTLIELLIVLGIAGVIMTIISSFLISNIKTFNRAETQVELQYHGQAAMNFLGGKTIQAKGITGIWDGETDKINSSIKLAISKIELDILELDGSNEVVIPHVLVLNSNNKLLHGKGNSAKTEVANFISKIEVEPLPNGSTFNDAKGISIWLTLQKDGQIETISNKIYFRNHTD